MNNRFLHLALGTSLFLILTGCAGYRVGNIGGRNIQGVKSVYVAVAKNETFEPGLQVLTTDAILRAFDNDGTFETTTSEKADSELKVDIVKMDRVPLRGSRENVLLTAEYQVTLTAKITFINRRLGRTVLEKEVSGTTTYFAQTDLQESERQALPLAEEDLAKNAVRLITEGW